MGQVICYERVNRRENKKEVSIETFFENPREIFSLWGEPSVSVDAVFRLLKEQTEKQYRNDLKREYLPAVSLDQVKIMSIDIDGLEDSPEAKQSIIGQLKNDESIYCLQESASGNLVIFYKFDCSTEDYQYLYYKKYLELTLRLEIEIDYLPEINRLRYVSLGEKYIYNKDAKPLTELLKVNRMLTPKKEVKEKEPAKAFELLTKAATTSKVFKS